MFLMWHDRGLNFIYSSALATWTYVTLRGATHLIRVTIEHLDLWTIVVAFLFGVLFYYDLRSKDEDVDEKFRGQIDVVNRVKG